MSPMRILQIMLLMIVGVPFVVMNVWGFKATQYVMEETARNEAALASGGTKPTGAFTAQPPALTAISRGLRKRPSDHARMFSPADLNADRTVSVRHTLTWSDLLRPEETLPDEPFRELFAQARAMTFATRECATINATIGSLCGAPNVKATLTKEGAIFVDVELAYVPNYDMGYAKEERRVRFSTIRFDPFDSKYGKTRIEYTALNRAKILMLARNVCEDIRNEFGTCVINRADFRLHRRSRRDAEPTLNASVGLSVYGVQDRHEALQAAVDRALHTH